jgi:hypothetical protein
VRSHGSSSGEKKRSNIEPLVLFTGGRSRITCRQNDGRLLWPSCRLHAGTCANGPYYHYHYLDYLVIFLAHWQVREVLPHPSTCRRPTWSCRIWPTGEGTRSIASGHKTAVRSGYAGKTVLDHKVGDLETKFLQKTYTLKQLSLKIRPALNPGLGQTNSPIHRDALD